MTPIDRTSFGWEGGVHAYRWWGDEDEKLDLLPWAENADEE